MTPAPSTEKKQEGRGVVLDNEEKAFLMGFLFGLVFCIGMMQAIVEPIFK